MKRLLTVALGASLLILGGCSEAPKKVEEKKKEPEKPAEPVTGRYAVYQMFNAARAWAPDIQALKLNSILLPEVKREPGKAAAWQVTFVSPGKNRARSYTYSVVEAEANLHKGVFAGLEESWSGGGANKPFLMAALKTDSDAAYETALKKGADYAKKNPNKPVSYLLELTSRFPNPAWRVIWGESVGTSNFSIFIDASTGEYLQTMR